MLWIILTDISVFNIRDWTVVLLINSDRFVMDWHRCSINFDIRWMNCWSWNKVFFREFILLYHLCYQYIFWHTMCFSSSPVALINIIPCISIAMTMRWLYMVMILSGMTMRWRRMRMWLCRVSMRMMMVRYWCIH